MVSKHYVAYHNADQRGAYKGSPDGAGWFETNKPTHPRQGDVLWCFEGKGSPKRYRLFNRGVVTRIDKRKAGPALVHYQSTEVFEPRDTTDLPWFRTLAKKQGSFAFGLNPIGNQVIVDSLEEFVLHAKQTRSSPRASIEESVRALLGKDMLRALHAVAESVRTANALDPSKWGLRIDRRAVMLKVGFVETLQAGNGSIYLLVKTNRVTRQQRLNAQLNFDGKSYYKNAPGCGHCEFASSKVSLHYPALLAAHKAALQIASQSQRHTTTAKNHSSSLIDFISEMTGQTLPQPSYVPQANNLGSVSKLYSSQIFVEGAHIQTLVTRYERDPAARAACISYYGYECAVCETRLSDTYGTAAAELIHVHHLNPISEFGEQTVDPIADLRPVCPNCHAVIHAGGSIRTIEQVRLMLEEASKKKL